jgi:DNA-binding NarL/FixJ family response regulator
LLSGLVMSVLEHVERGLSLGMSYKEIAYEAGVAMSTVWRAQTTLAARHRCENRVLLITRLRSGERPARVRAPLSECERVVVELARSGRSNADIAATRSVAVRTVANQLASAYRKLGIHSRSELAAITFDEFIEADAAE